MILKGVNLETGQEFQTVSPNFDNEFLSLMSGTSVSDEEIKRYIDNLNISADVKSLLFQFTKITLKAGDFLLKIGRKIVEFVYLLYKEYKHATFGMLFGAIVGFLISSIPVLGVILGAVFTPIAIGLGLILGLNEDIKDKHLERKITEIVAKFDPLKVVPV
jgi:uncharacterized membrane protein